jgi:Tfp pilus assembly protein PilF
MVNDPEKGPRGLNGLGAISMMRSLTTTGEIRATLERTAIEAFQRAVQAQPSTWQFAYNWALANMLAGNYAAAYEGMNGISAAAGNNNNKLTGFWKGLAALRLGDPGEALASFNSVLDEKVPQGGNDAFVELYAQAKRLANEGLADTYWANRDPEAAYRSYYRLMGSRDYEELLPKWERLGLQQRGYERLADDLGGLISLQGYGDSARVHHDRARLLTFLGRNPEAESEYKEALRVGQDDAPLLISYGQALENAGDHNGALVQAESALRKLGVDPGSSDLSNVARVAATNSTMLDFYNSQQILDAYLLRARAWGKSGQGANVSNLVKGLDQAAAANASASEAGLLYLYAGYAAEAGGLANEAVSSYGSAWGKLQEEPLGAPGRAAALSGLARVSAPDAGLQALKNNSYDPVSPPKGVVTDPDAPDILFTGAQLLKAQGKSAEAANTMRVAALIANNQSVRSLTGFSRPAWYSTATTNPSNAVLEAAGAARNTGSGAQDIAALRYREAFALDPAQAAAWNNLGVLYSQAGKNDLAGSYLSAAGKASPGYAPGRHNQAALEYRQGPGNFFNAETAQGAVIRSVGPASLNWSNNLGYDDRGPLPSPVAGDSGLLPRIAAVVILLLLLAHTWVGSDRVVEGRVHPVKGLLGRLASGVDHAAGQAIPGLARPGSGNRSLLLTILIPGIIGMLGLAWLSGRGSLEVALVYLPAALLVALLAFGANEVSQYLAARRAHAGTLHHVWPFGALLGILSIPLGFVYGWQTVTRVQPASTEASEESDKPRRGTIGRRARTEEDRDLIYEAQVEAAAEEDSADGKAAAMAVAMPAGSASMGLTPAARIMFAGLVANLVVGLIFALAYWLTGWPSLRLGMFASMLVLAFTAVSEPPADGWTLYRRNPALWLAVFVFASAVLTLLAANLI